MPDFLNDIPSLPYPLKILLLLFAGIILLRTAGKKSLSSMTVAEAVMRIAVGTIIIGPLALKTEWEAIYGGTLFIIGIILLMKMQIWFPKTREMLIGVPSVLIKDGKMRLGELRKARMTTDELEVALRQQKIGSIEDVELAILESNGQLSTTLKPGKAPATKEDIEKIVSLLVGNGILSSSENKSSSTPPLFKEVYDEAKDEDFKPEEQ